MQFLPKNKKIILKKFIDYSKLQDTTEKTTIILLELKTKKELEKFKVSERDTYNDIIEMLIEDSLEVNEK